jgi:outer membrane protein
MIERCTVIGHDLLAGLATVLAGALAVSAPAQSNKPLTLGECLRIAEAGHPDLQAARALVDAAAARLKVSHAAFLPRLDLDASYIRQTYNFAAQPGTTPTQVALFSNGERFSNAPYYDGGLNLHQTLYDFGHTRGIINRSEAELEAARANFLRARDVVDLNVRLAYDGVLAAKELVRIRERAVDKQTQHLDQARAFYEVGTRPKIDVTEQEVALASAQVDLRQAQEDWQVARAALATAMGLPLDQAPEPVNPLKQGSEPDRLDQLLAAAEHNRPDVQSLRDELTAAEADIKVAQANFRPTLSLSSFFDYRNLRFPLVYNWSVGEFVAQNVFSGGANRATLAEARARWRAAQANLDSLLARVRQEVYTDFSELEVAKDKIDLAIHVEAEAKENLELAEGRYQAGYGNVIELTDAQTLATTSEAQEIIARYDYQTAAARLDAAIGRRVQ